MTPALVLFCIALGVSLVLTLGSWLLTRRKHGAPRVTEQPVQTDYSRQPLTFTKPASKGFQKSKGGSGVW